MLDYCAIVAYEVYNIVLMVGLLCNSCNLKYNIVSMVILLFYEVIY